MQNIAVTLATLQSHNHIVGDIERGVKIYERGGVQFTEIEPNNFMAHVPHKGGETKTASVSFTKDGQDIQHHYCHCAWRSSGKPVCRHVVALVLAIQGGIVKTGITLGKSATVSVTVETGNTAKAVGSGSLEVFATPMMIALMERAACEVLADVLEDGQTSVGTLINVEHTAASPIGAVITATAVIDYVFGRKIEFSVTAADGTNEIGKGKHTRMIVDATKFMSRVNKRGDK